MPATTTRRDRQPLGPLQLVATGPQLSAIHFPDRHRRTHRTPPPAPSWQGPACSWRGVLRRSAPRIRPAARGRRHGFPAGRLAGVARDSLGRAAQLPGHRLRATEPRAVRAVGAANGRNPLPIVVPCHRVIGANGSLTGFAGGWSKKLLLGTGGSLPTSGR